MLSGLVGCSGTSAERNEAVAFYKAAYPVIMGIADHASDWDVALVPTTSPSEIVDLAYRSDSAFHGYLRILSNTYAPPPLQQLKDNMVVILNTGIELFTFAEDCVSIGSLYYCDQADSKVREVNRYLMRAADKWDDGIAHYDIKPSEFVP